MHILLQRNVRNTALAVANAEGCVYCLWCCFVRRSSPVAAALGTVRFLLAPCNTERDPYGPAGGAVRAVVRRLKRMRSAACVAVVAPAGTDQNAIGISKLRKFNSQVRVRMQLGSFPGVVTIKVARLDRYDSIERANMHTR